MALPPHWKNFGIKIDPETQRRFKTLCTAKGWHMSRVMDYLMRGFIHEHDSTPVVQLSLEDIDYETNYNNPQYEPLKQLLESSRTTMANRAGRLKLVNRISKTYSKLRKRVSIDPQLKVEVDSVLELLVKTEVSE